MAQFARSVYVDDFIRLLMSDPETTHRYTIKRLARSYVTIASEEEHYFRTRRDESPENPWTPGLQQLEQQILQRCAKFSQQYRDDIAHTLVVMASYARIYAYFMAKNEATMAQRYDEEVHRQYMRITELINAAEADLEAQEAVHAAEIEAQKAVHVAKLEAQKAAHAAEAHHHAAPAPQQDASQTPQKAPERYDGAEQANSPDHAPSAAQGALQPESKHVSSPGSPHVLNLSTDALLNALRHDLLDSETGESDTASFSLFAILYDKIFEHHNALRTPEILRTTVQQRGTIQVNYVKLEDGTILHDVMLAPELVYRGSDGTDYALVQHYGAFSWENHHQNMIAALEAFRDSL